MEDYEICEQNHREDVAQLLCAIRDLLCGYKFDDLALDHTDWHVLLQKADAVNVDKNSLDCEEFRRVWPEFFAECDE